MEGAGAGGCGRTAAFVVVVVVVVAFGGLGGAITLAVLGAAFDFGGSGRLGGGGWGSSSRFRKIRCRTAEGRERTNQRRSPRRVDHLGE